MGTSSYYNVCFSCDGLNCREYLDIGSERLGIWSYEEAEKKAIEVGWTRTLEDDLLCPYCSYKTRED